MYQDYYTTGSDYYAPTSVAISLRWRHKLAAYAVWCRLDTSRRMRIPCLKQVSPKTLLASLAQVRELRKRRMQAKANLSQERRVVADVLKAALGLSCVSLQHYVRILHF